MPAFVMVELDVRPEFLDQAADILEPLIASALKRPGAMQVELLRSPARPTRWLLWQQWERRADYEAYLAWRGEEGGAAPFVAMLSQAPVGHFYRDDGPVA